MEMLGDSPFQPGVAGNTSLRVAWVLAVLFGFVVVSVETAV
jgi:hypothetical protein